MVPLPDPGAPMINVLALLPLANDLLTVTATNDLEVELVNKLVNRVLENMVSEIASDWRYFHWLCNILQIQEFFSQVVQLFTLYVPALRVESCCASK